MEVARQRQQRLRPPRSSSGLRGGEPQCSRSEFTFDTGRRQGNPWRLHFFRYPDNLRACRFILVEEAFPGSGLYHPHSDHFGSTLQTAGSAGITEASHACYAFGAQSGSSSSNQTDLPVPPRTRQVGALHQFLRLPSKSAADVLC